MRNYVILAPPYGRSAGVRALYMLSDMLERKGFSAPVLCHTPSPGHHCMTDFTVRMQREDIAVYPETVKGNPLRFHRVARYVLYYPGRLGGDEVFDEREHVVVWDRTYLGNVPELTFSLLDRRLFYDAGLPRIRDCIYEHKSCGVKRRVDVAGAVRITMKYPAMRSDLAALLQTTRVLYSYDHNSLLNDEAAACGAAVKLVTDEGLVDHVPTPEPSEEDTQRQLAQFIEATQSLAPYPPPPGPKALRLKMTLRLFFHNAVHACTGSDRSRLKAWHDRMKLGLPGR